MYCKVCGNEIEPYFQSIVLDRYSVSYFKCKKCNFIQTETPYWLEEAYSSAIHISDTGLMRRNIENVKITSIVLSLFFNIKEKFLDFGGGYGVFVRMMRDIGFEFYWFDKYCENIFSKEFEYRNEIVELVTAFEVFEHFTEPLEDIKKLIDLGENKAVLFSTLLFDHNKHENVKDWWYFGFEHGQHISIYSKETLKYIANELNVNYFCINEGLHLFTCKRINNFYIKYIVRLINKLGLEKVLRKAMNRIK